MHATLHPSLRARRRMLAPLPATVPRRAIARLQVRRVRAPILATLILLNTILPHPVAASAPVTPGGSNRWSTRSLSAIELAPPSVEGIASWYGNPRHYGEPALAWYTRSSVWGEPIEFYAAAGPELRRLLGDPNPYHEHYPVTITNPATGRTIEAVVVDWCSCSAGRDHEKLIDLSPAAFEALGVPLSRGIQEVELLLGHLPRLEPLPTKPDRLPSATPERPAPITHDVSAWGWFSL